MGHANSSHEGAAAIAVAGSTDADLGFLLKKVRISTDSIEHLQHAFRKFDIKRDGQVHFDEFCAKVKVEPTHFLRKLFEFFGTTPDAIIAARRLPLPAFLEPADAKDLVGCEHKFSRNEGEFSPEGTKPIDYRAFHHRSSSGEHCSVKEGEPLLPSLNFSEFALFAWFFLTLDEFGLASFLYKLLTGARKKHAHKRIQIESLEDEMREYLGEILDERAMRAFINHILVTYNNVYETIAEDDFVVSVLKAKSLLFPLVTYQIDMRKKIIGEAFWTEKIGIGTEFLDSIVDITLSLHKLFRHEAREEKKCIAQAEAEESAAAIAAAEARSAHGGPHEHRDDATRHCEHGVYHLPGHH